MERGRITDDGPREADAYGHGGKRNVLGVLVDVVDYDAVVRRVLEAARARRPLAVTALAVHGVMTGVREPAHNARLNGLDVVAPDGQPVRWALNLLHGAGLREWVSGPELTLRVLRGMAGEHLPVYLYGSTPEILGALSRSLRHVVPGLRIAGAEPSKFRTARPGEEIAVAERIRASSARLVLVGLGCPRQEVFVAAMRPLLDVPLLAVGAAFDYHAGRLRPAPLWMQRSGLAWCWRLAMEPGRLWRRYLGLNLGYLVRLAAQATRLWQPCPPPPRGDRADIVPL
ncbi:polymer biosynthesis protein, WecB/TagA/CpsF family [Micromonospora pattaloongensis]|uniref:Polymer biosynthesis protein, WecB/TagA/CpsF family n=1 Tax=Micromonospora pattaloongensis TaxID=405436 RepID=A0A1H3HH81_9ACTN|nr:WecB/TagA/CpsF family glycosyltransferase [Micromonospora pattaloongensis]SDY14811.1 polymer biosynthesis protein, WecB/TagA/CpsF family [Micromonospora pattaloongensis]